MVNGVQWTFGKSFFQFLYEYHMNCAVRVWDDECEKCRKCNLTFFRGNEWWGNFEDADCVTKTLYIPCKCLNVFTENFRNFLGFRFKTDPIKGLNGKKAHIKGSKCRIQFKVLFQE